MKHALEIAFKKSVEAGTSKDKEAIANAMFKSNRTIQLPPKQGNIPVDKIQSAVNTVSKKKNESKPTK
jgi:hypothetical protein